MQTQKELEQQIVKSEGELIVIREQIFKSMKRMDVIEIEIASAISDAKISKEERQRSLAEGGDSAKHGAAVKTSLAAAETLQDEKAGLQSLLQELRSKEALFTNQIKDGRLKILQGQSIELAKTYNAQAAELAKIVESLNAVSLKIQESTGGGTAGFVVFYPESGALDNIPRIFFDESGLNLEQFVAKYPGRYHSNNNLPVMERSFYDFTEHKRLLREGGVL